MGWEAVTDISASAKELLRYHIEVLLQSFAQYEQVKRFILLPDPFSIENGALTNTLTLKRDEVSMKYKELIDWMYEDDHKGVAKSSSAINPMKYS